MKSKWVRRLGIEIWEDIDKGMKEMRTSARGVDANFYVMSPLEFEQFNKMLIDHNYQKEKQNNES